jgi:hypothetical protein
MSLNPNAVIIANKLKGAGYSKAHIAGVAWLIFNLSLALILVLTRAVKLGRLWE